MRVLLAFVCVVVFVDTIFYAAIAPLLPVYVEDLGLSKTQAGLLTGAYPAGTLVAALPSGWLAGRLGTKATLLCGLVLMSLSSVVFAFGDSFAVLFAARLVQGFGGAASWAGALGWLIEAGPGDRRGQLIGTAMSAALVGVVCGPLFGAVADGLGPEPVFSAIGVLGCGLIACAARLPAPPVIRRPLSVLLPAVRDRRVLLAMWLVMLPGFGFGAIEVLAPLELGALGAGTAVIAAAFVLAAALEAVVNPVAGRVSDRRGRRFPIVVGLAAAVGASLVFTLPESVAVLFAVVVLATPVIGIAFTPAMALLSDGAEHHGIPQGLGLAFTNLGWATGQTIGTIGSGKLAEIAGNALPYLVLAAIYAATVTLLVRTPAPALALQAAGEPSGHGPDHHRT